MLLRYLQLLVILIFLTIPLYSVDLKGKWASSTGNIVYLDADQKEVKVQIILDSGETYTWFGRWLVQDKEFIYKNSIDEYISVIENDNMITVTGRKNKEVFVWHRKNKVEFDAHKYAIDNEYQYSDLAISWCTDEDAVKVDRESADKAGKSRVYSWKLAEDKWVGFIVPIYSIDYPNWGLAVHFLKKDGQLQLTCMRPMKLSYNQQNKAIWKDEIPRCAYIKDSKWKLTFSKADEFSFEFNGAVTLGNGRVIKHIKMLGRSKILYEGQGK